MSPPQEPLPPHITYVPQIITHDTFFSGKLSNISLFSECLPSRMPILFSKAGIMLAQRRSSVNSCQVSK